MSYKVYTGFCNVTNAGNLAWVNKMLLYDSEESNAVNDASNMYGNNKEAEPYILDPVLTLEKNSIGTFTYTLPSNTVTSSAYQTLLKEANNTLNTSMTAQISLLSRDNSGFGTSSDGLTLYYDKMLFKVTPARATNIKVSVTTYWSRYYVTRQQSGDDDDGGVVTVYEWLKDYMKLTPSYTISSNGVIELTITTQPTGKGYYGLSTSDNYKTSSIVLATINISAEVDGKTISTSYDYYGSGETWIAVNYITYTITQTSNVTATVTSTYTNGYSDKALLKQMKTAIYQNDTMMWLGYISDFNVQFDRSIEVTCEEIIGLMQDDYALIRKNGYNVSLTDPPDGNGGNSILYNCIMIGGEGSSAVTQYFKVPTFNIGTVTMLNGKLFDINTSGTIYGTRWDVLQTYLLDEYDGYLRPRYVTQTDGSIRIYIDYLSDITDTTEQTIEYGVNLVDMTYELEYPSDFANSIYSTAAVTSTSGWWIFKSTTTTVYTSTARDEESIAKYGLVQKFLMVSNPSSQAVMDKACQEELEKHTQTLEPTITIKAIDCMDIDGESATDRLGFLKKTRIISKPHDIDVTLVCTKATVYLNKPDKCEYTYGYAPKKLTDQQGYVESTGSMTKSTTGALVSWANSKN